MATDPLEMFGDNSHASVGAARRHDEFLTVVRSVMDEVGNDHSSAVRRVRKRLDMSEREANDLVMHVMRERGIPI